LAPVAALERTAPEVVDLWPVKAGVVSGGKDIHATKATGLPDVIILLIFIVLPKVIHVLVMMQLVLIG
jgi:hypothetical protein